MIITQSRTANLPDQSQYLSQVLAPRLILNTITERVGSGLVLLKKLICNGKRAAGSGIAPQSAFPPPSDAASLALIERIGSKHYRVITFCLNTSRPVQKSA